MTTVFFRSSENKRSAKPKYNTDSRLSKSEFGKILSLAKKSKDWTEVEEFYAMTFANCANICATFKKDLEQNGAKKENPELKIDLLHYVLDKIETVNGSVQKAMLKSIVTCLLG